MGQKNAIDCSGLESHESNIPGAAVTYIHNIKMLSRNHSNARTDAMDIHKRRPGAAEAGMQSVFKWPSQAGKPVVDDVF
jgi:hypothetical protein